MEDLDMDMEFGADMDMELDTDMMDLVRKMSDEERYPEGQPHFKIIRLDSMEMIAKYSFVAHRSINHLDLSLREYSSMKEKRKVLIPLLFCAADPAFSKKFVSTADGCRKTLVMERRFLYALHLDIAVARESDFLSMASHDHGPNWKPKTICLNSLYIPRRLYKDAFRRFIDRALERQGMKMEPVRRTMALMKSILGCRMYQIKSLEDRILQYLFANTNDSGIVKEFLPILDFGSFIQSSPKMNLAEYVLFHAHVNRYDLELNDTKGIHVTESFFNLRFKYTELLLQYQNAPFYYDYDCNVLVPMWMRDTPNDWYPEDLQLPFDKGIMSKRRFQLWLQIFHTYTCRNQPPLYGRVAGTLRLLWRSLPDSYFTLEEIMDAYQDLPSRHEIIENAYRFYAASLASDLIPDTPRTLLHFCRTSIRKSLCYSLQLPFGIEHLRIPPKLKAYLKLEK